MFYLVLVYLRLLRIVMWLVRFVLRTRLNWNCVCLCTRTTVVTLCFLSFGPECAAGKLLIRHSTTDWHTNRPTRPTDLPEANMNYKSRSRTFGVCVHFDIFFNNKLLWFCFVFTSMFSRWLTIPISTIERVPRTHLNCVRHFIAPAANKSIADNSTASACMARPCGLYVYILLNHAAAVTVRSHKE